MKKLLLTLSALATLSVGATATQRTTLHEEFTGENCPPCASTNPTFWALLNGGTNPTKVIHLAYMCPIPSSGWFYLQTQTLSDARQTYYSVPFAPYGRFDGAVPDPGCSGGSSAGHPGCFTQADIDAEYAVASPFTMTCTNTWNATYDSVVTTVNVTCNTAYSGTLYLRTALAQNVDFPSPPGTNGETHFENVVRAMYPSALGTSIAGTWTVGMTQSYTIRGAVPSFVDKSDTAFMVAFIQNDADKSVQQAVKATPLPPVPNDCAILTLTAPGLVCVANGPYSAAHSVTLKNAGSNTITSCTIYYQVDGAGAFLSFPWTGSIAAGGTSVVSIPSTSLTVAGPAFHSFYDSVANVNGGGDQNMGNNTKGASYFTESTNAVAMPYTTSFETVDAGKFYTSDNNANNERWVNYYSTAGLGHTGPYAMGFNCYSFAVGEVEVFTLPEITTASPSAIDFWVAYAQYDATTNDKLELVYSTDCGVNWTSLWSKAGSALATAPATTSAFVPTAAQYVMKSVDISSVPTSNAILGFRGTSDYGNYVWVDDVNVRAGAPVAVKEVAETVNVNIFPNPATNQATVEFTLVNATEVTMIVVDQLGRVVSNVTNNMAAGKNTVDINTSAFAAGVYHVSIRTTEGVYTQALTVAK